MPEGSRDYLVRVCPICQKANAVFVANCAGCKQKLPDTGGTMFASDYEQRFRKVTGLEIPTIKPEDPPFEEPQQKGGDSRDGRSE